MEYEFCVETDHDARAFEALAAAEFRLYRQRRGGLLWCAAVGVPVFLLSLIWKGTGSPGPTWCPTSERQGEILARERHASVRQCRAVRNHQFL